MALQGIRLKPVTRGWTGGSLPPVSGYPFGDTFWVESEKQLYKAVYSPYPTLVWQPVGTGERVASFSFSSGVLSLQAVSVGATCSRVQLSIEVPFDDPSATITVGTTLSPSMLMASTDNYPAYANQYEVSGLKVFALPDDMIITINPGASTQGSGRILYYYQGA